MTKTKGYSLWLMPSGEVYNKLADLIFQLSKEYSAPKFEPHITLIGEVTGLEDEIIKKTSQLANFIKSCSIKLTNVDNLDEYFNYLFIKAEKTDDLMETNSKAREIFNRQADPECMPHLSLMYGNFPPEIKEEIIKNMGKDFNHSFEARSIHLFKTEGKVRDWYRLKEFTLR